MKDLFKNIFIFFFIFFVIAGLLSAFSMNQQKNDEIDTQNLVSAISENKVDKIEIDDNKLIVYYLSGETKFLYKEPNETVSEMLSNYGVSAEKLQNIKVTVLQDSPLEKFASQLLPFLIPFLIIAVFIYFMLRQVQGANNKAMMFGKAKTRDASKTTNIKVRFNDVAGIREAKAELQEVVDFLINPKKYIRLGAKIPKGVLLVGPPGVGKTLLAKAVAGEAGVPFFSISGSEFVEMFVGVGASRVRDLFLRAKKSAPCIIFVDELDAVGRQRGSGLGGSHDEREQTLNQILVEMDGFEANAGVIVLAATNRPDVLDPALLRPGRFDRRVILEMPSLKDRLEILKVHGTDKPMAKDVDLELIAQRTAGFSGADLSNLLNEAAILAAKQGQNKIKNLDIINSIEKVMLGPERKSHVLSDKEKEVTAYHEAGHAIVAHFLAHTDPVHKISIVSRGHAAGYTLKLPSEEKYLKTKSEFLDELAVLLAGRIAEKIIFSEITVGASNDIKQATNICKMMIMKYGMNDELGWRTLGKREEMIFLGKEIHEQSDYSEKTAEKIDDQIDKMLKEAQIRAAKILKDHKAEFIKVAQILLEKESIEKDEFVQIVGNRQKEDSAS